MNYVAYVYITYTHVSGLYRAKQVQINNKEREPIVRGLLSFEFKKHDKI